MWILKKWSEWGQGGGKVFQEEGAARTIAGRLKTAWRAQMCLQEGRGVAGMKRRDVEK